MDLEFAKLLYFRELDRRAELDSAPTFRVAILALLGGVFSFYMQHFQPASNVLSILFLASAAATVFFSVLSVIWIIRSYSGYVWAYLPLPEQLATHYEELVEYHSRYPSETNTAETLFATHLRQQFIEAASRNARNNNRRSEFIYRASLFLSVAVVFSLLAGLPVLSEGLRVALL